MIPIRDANPPSRTPVVTYALIAANVAVFAHQASLGPQLGERFIRHWGLVPAHFTAEALITSMFVHGGLMHVLGNMWFLHIFGDNVEDRLGRLQYLCFYLACGCAAGLAQTLAGPGSDVPMVGASGAIAGVTGGYLLLFPHARIRTLVPLFVVLYSTDLPAYVFLLFWFVVQVQGGCSTLHGAGPGVAFFAHIGGFVAGAFLTVAMAGRRPLTRRDEREGWV